MGEAKRRKAAGDFPAPTPKPPKAAVDTVSWEVVGDLASHPSSAAVLAALEELRKDYPGMGGGKPMVVVLETATGDVVLRAQTLGLGAFMGLVDRLQELDLIDRLEHRSGPERGVDAAFR
jgi:hypothetical protein